MIYQMSVPAPSKALYPLHQYVEDVREQVGLPRLRWTYRDGQVVMRAQAPLRGWDTLAIPSRGETIDFRLLAAPRIGGRDSAGARDAHPRRPRHRPVYSRDEALRWLAWQFQGREGHGQPPYPGAGLRLLSADAALVEMTVSRKSGLFPVRGALFQGRAEVTDPDLLGKALNAGIGDAKAFGFGMLLIGDDDF